MDLDPLAWVVHRHVVDVTIDDPDLPGAWPVAERERPRLLDGSAYDAALSGQLSGQLAGHLAGARRVEAERAVPRAVRG